MRFEEILPALLKGKKIRKIYWSEDKYVCTRKGESSFLDQDGFIFIFGVDDFKNDDWEIVKEKKKVKLRDLTAEQYKTFLDSRCGNQIDGISCVDCPFCRTSCLYDKDDKCRIDNKDLYNNKFLDQEVEIEVDDD